jgi:hypothetical protein
VVLAAFLLILACSFPVQVMALYGHTPLELAAIAGKLAPLNWAIMVLAPATAWLAYRASPWLMAALPTLTILVFYNNWLVGAVGNDYSPGTAALASAAFVLGLAALLNREALQVILNPSSRWWMTPFRRRIALPVRFKLLSRGRTQRKSQDAYDEFYIRTFDLSESGAFIPLEQPGHAAGEAESRNLQIFSAILRNLAVGTQCYICLPLKDVSFIQCRAEVVRNTPGRGEYPAGVGIRFLGMSRAEKRRLSAFIYGSAGAPTESMQKVASA